MYDGKVAFLEYELAGRKSVFFCGITPGMTTPREVPARAVDVIGVDMRRTTNTLDFYEIETGVVYKDREPGSCDVWRLVPDATREHWTRVRVAATDVPEEVFEAFAEYIGKAR